MSARALMILGTASHAGKSTLTAAICRILADEGYRVAPFKAQNMSLNSAATPDSREIGRAQALQAEACRIAPRVEMNPVLIKPSSDTSSQVVVLGRVWGQVTASDYHLRRVEELFPVVLESYRALAAEHDIIVLEGAGSPAEINLKDHDIVNMRMAKAANARCLLVGDIDRGGVFASLLGTVELLDPAERALLDGYIVNKFRGDQTLLAPGLEMISRRIHLPCAGVVPHLPDIGLEEEDSVALEDRRTPQRAWTHGHSPDRALRIGVVAFPHMANFTDFDALAAEPSVELAFLDDPATVMAADLLVLPGSKQTIDDLAWLRGNGFVDAIQRFRSPAGIAGICGGMQMLGHSIEDPTGAENNGRPRNEPGLDLLPITTVLGEEKVTRLVHGRLESQTLFGQPVEVRDFQGYEIHLGHTIYGDGAQPFSEVGTPCSADAPFQPDGAIGPGRVFGTYVHGLLQDDAFRHAVLAAARAACGLSPITRKAFVHTGREARIDRLAAHVRTALNMDLIHRSIGHARRHY